MRTHWHVSRTQLPVLETRGLKLSSCSPNLLASAGTTHPLFCTGGFVSSDVSNPPPTWREHLLLLRIILHSVIVIRMSCLLSAVRHGQGPLRIVDNTAVCMGREVTTKQGVISHREAAQKEPRCWQEFSSPAVLCTAQINVQWISVLHHARALEMGHGWAVWFSWIDIQQLVLFLLLESSWQRGCKPCCKTSSFVLLSEGHGVGSAKQLVLSL